MAKSRSSPRYAKLRQILVEARKSRELSQVDLADALGRPQSFVSKYETGERRLDVIELMDVAATLECDVVGLVETLLAMRG